MDAALNNRSAVREQSNALYDPIDARHVLIRLTQSYMRIQK